MSAENVRIRNLVSTEVKRKDITKEYQSYCETETNAKHFQGMVLGYVTPVSNIIFMIFLIIFDQHEICSVGSNMLSEDLFFVSI